LLLLLLLLRPAPKAVSGKPAPTAPLPNPPLASPREGGNTSAPAWRFNARNFLRLTLMPRNLARPWRAALHERKNHVGAPHGREPLLRVLATKSRSRARAHGALLRQGRARRPSVHRSTSQPNEDSTTQWRPIPVGAGPARERGNRDVRNNHFPSQTLRKQAACVLPDISVLRQQPRARQLHARGQGPLLQTRLIDGLLATPHPDR
jgi:hypothetical protein